MGLPSYAFHASHAAPMPVPMGNTNACVLVTLFTYSVVAGHRDPLALVHPQCSRICRMWVEAKVSNQIVGPYGAARSVWQDLIAPFHRKPNLVSRSVFG